MIDKKNLTESQIKKLKKQYVAEMCHRKYSAYVMFVHKGRWKPGKVHKYICNKVQDFVERETDEPYEIMILSMPPQHGKSQSITETLPSWYLGKYPEKRVIEVSYNDTFAEKFGRKNLGKIKEYGWVFGIRTEKEAAKEFEIKDHSGSMISRGVMSGITGNAGDLIIIDDPIKSRMEADSETFRRRLAEEWTDSIRSRTQAGSKIILIQTRWHEDDLAGYILRTEKNVEYINIPVEAEEGDVLGRKIGEALAPEIGKDNEWLRKFKAGFTEGARTWNALYQGHPSAQEGNLLKRTWWKYYRELPRLDILVMSVDATFKDNSDNDYVAIQLWGKARADYYMVKAIKRRMSFVETINQIMSLQGDYPDIRAVYIEDKANGPAIISMLRDKISGIIPVEPQGSKIARVNAVSPVVEAGNVYLPEGLSETDDFVEETAAFPNGKHDDQVDSFSQALNKLIPMVFTYAEEEEYKMPFNIGESKNPLGYMEEQEVI